MNNKSMKLTLGACCAALFAVPAMADYQIDFKTFNNLNSPSSSTNPIFDVDTATKLTGTAGYEAALFAGTSANNLTLVAGSTKLFNSAGFVSAGLQTIFDASVTGNTIGFYQIKVWNVADGADFDTANAKVGVAHVGVSPIEQISLLGYDPNNTLAPVIGIPAANLQSSFALQLAPVPEPTTVTLGVVGLAGLLMRRRKQQ